MIRTQIGLLIFFQAGTCELTDAKLLLVLILLTVLCVDRNSLIFSYLHFFPCGHCALFDHGILDDFPLGSLLLLPNWHIKF